MIKKITVVTACLATIAPHCRHLTSLWSTSSFFISEILPYFGRLPSFEDYLRHKQLGVLATRQVTAPTSLPRVALLSACVCVSVCVCVCVCVTSCMCREEGLWGDCFSAAAASEQKGDASRDFPKAKQKFTSSKKERKHRTSGDVSIAHAHLAMTMFKRCIVQP